MCRKLITAYNKKSYCFSSYLAVNAEMLTIHANSNFIERILGDERVSESEEVEHPSFLKMLTLLLEVL